MGTFATDFFCRLLAIVRSWDRETARAATVMNN